MSRLKLLSVVLCLAFFSSCITFFDFVGKKEEIRGNKLAVISGLKNQNSVIFARIVTEELARVSSFTIMSQQEISARLGNYPSIIRGPYESAYMNIIEKYDNTDTARLNEIQKKLGVDNLYVIWAPVHVEMQIGGSTATPYQIHAITQFFSYPGGKEVGRSMFKTMYAEGFVIGSNVPRSPEDAIRYASEQIAVKIAKKTGTLK